MTFTCTLKNTGAVVGDEVIIVYHAVSDAIRKMVGGKHPVPLKDVVEFARVTLQPGASQLISFTLDTDKAFGITTADGSRQVYAGEHDVIFSVSSGNSIVKVVV